MPVIGHGCQRWPVRVTPARVGFALITKRLVTKRLATNRLATERLARLEREAGPDDQSTTGTGLDPYRSAQGLDELGDDPHAET